MTTIRITSFIALNLGAWLGCSSEPRSVTNGAAGAAPAPGASAAGGGAAAVVGAGASSGGVAVAGAASEVGGSGAGGSGAGGSAGVGGTTEPQRPAFSGEYRQCGSQAPEIALQEVVGGLTSPTFAISDPLDASRLFILEQNGAVILAVNGAKKTIASVPVDNPEDRQERGLMSMAFHPSFGFDGEKRVYLSYTSGNADLNVAEAILDGDVLDVQNLQPFISIPHANGANRHFGAMIAIGGDGYLYLSSGDGEGNNGQQNGQNKNSILSAMLRLDVEDPATPVVGNIQDGDPRILHKGFRNPWRFSFDLGNGDLFLGDVGNSTEEINYAKAGSGPMNFLWPNDSGQGALFAYPTVNGAERAAVVGGYVYRGSQMPDMQGRYFFGDFERGDIYVLTYDGTKVCDKSTVWDEGKGTPVAFGQDAQGELYVMSWTGAPCPESNCPGEPGEDSLYRIRQK